MSTAPSIPDDLLRFLDTHVESFEQLEILRILGEERSKPWTVDDLAREAQIQPAALVVHLAALEQRGLITVQALEPAMQCRYGPKKPELEGALNRLLQFYRERPVTLIKHVYARTNDRLRALADSFRLRRDS